MQRIITSQTHSKTQDMQRDYYLNQKKTLEINPRHPLVKKLAEAKDSNPELAKLVALQLLDNSLIAAGLLEDARDTVSRMNTLMEKAMG